MGDSIETWRAKIGQWCGGRPQKSTNLQHHIAQNSNHIGYMKIRFLVLLSLLVIGCVELNPGPNHVSNVLQSKKNLYMRKGLWGNCTGYMGDKNTNNSVPKIIMEIGNCWKP
jgi:hypothetical protein